MNQTKAATQLLLVKCFSLFVYVRLNLKKIYIFLAPVKPNSSQWLTVNSTAITLWLDAWGDGGCSILYYVIEYRQESRSDWILSSNHIPPTEKTYTISDLRPGTKYFLKIMVYNNAGSTQGVYNATTLGTDGCMYVI